MKTTLKIVIVAILAYMMNLPATGENSLAQGSTDKKTVSKMNKSIKKEVKRLQAEGYGPEVGAPAMEFQLRRSFDKEFELDERGRHRWMIGVGSAISGIENAARMHAITDAAINASILLESKIMGLIENDYNNKLYSREEFETLSQMKGVFSNLVAQTLPTGVPITSFVRDHNRFYEYQVRIAYPMEVLRANSTSVISKILKEENDELRKKFERITGLDKLEP